VVIESGRPIAQVGRELGVAPEKLRRYVRQLEADEGLRPDLPTSEEREEIKALRKEVFELRRANEILKAASVFFATELDADRPKRARSSTSSVRASASSRSAGVWACRRPPTISALLGFVALAALAPFAYEGRKLACCDARGPTRSARRRGDRAGGSPAVGAPSPSPARSCRRTALRIPFRAVPQRSGMSSRLRVSARPHRSGHRHRLRATVRGILR
jgi:transposase